MSAKPDDIGRGAMRRVCCGLRTPCPMQSPELANKLQFNPGEEIRSLRPVKNDGIYPHKEIGELLVRHGDAGIVRERWSFLGEIYYTVEFAARAAVVIMRGREMMRLVPQ